MEFVIGGKQRAVVEENVIRIRQLFGVQIAIANGTPETVWITLKEGRVEQAKTYIQALTNPEDKKFLTIPASLIRTLGPRSKEHTNLESEYGVVISFPQETTACITGSIMNVMLAMSKLEDLIEKHLKSSQLKTNRPLADFALKLGYEQEQINMVFEKLGPTVDKNTFLNELINVSGAGSRPADDRWSPGPPRGASTSRQNQYVGNGVYGGDPGIVARGVMPRPSANTPPSIVPQGYHTPVGNGINPYNRDLGVLPAHDGGVLARGFLPRTTRPSSPGINVNSSGVVARGIMPRTTAPSTQASSLTSSHASTSHPYIPRTTSQGSNSTYSNSNWSNSSYLSQRNEFDSSSYPPALDEMVIQMASRYQELPQSDLRPIVIDGSNVAMSHGNNKVFSCRGILLCVEWFRKRGHKQITVFVPSWRKESAKMDNPITDQQILYQLEEQGCLTFTPSRKVNGRRIVCYDDRYLIRLAESTNGVIVSNDNFKDLATENPKWRDVIEQRLLMYSFVNDMFMPPDDPLGRHGPTLDEFLHKGTQTHRRVCPYGRRCTYGARCKYHHPEREDTRLPIYLNLKMLFPNQETLILSVLKKYPQEKDADKLAGYVLSMMQ